MTSANQNNAWCFDPDRYPRLYETRLETYPILRRVGILLIITGFVGIVGGLVHGAPGLTLGGAALLLISLWLVATHVQTITLFADSIEIRDGKDVEIRHRSKLMGWKYAVESAQGEEAGKPCWILLVPNDDDVVPLMVQINRPELDRDFYNWVYTLPDLMQTAGTRPMPPELCHPMGEASLKK